MRYLPHGAYPQLRWSTELRATCSLRTTRSASARRGRPSRVSAGRYASRCRICHMGRVVLPKVHAAPCSPGSVVYRVTLKRSKSSKVAPGRNCQSLIGTGDGSMEVDADGSL